MREELLLRTAALSRVSVLASRTRARVCRRSQWPDRWSATAWHGAGDLILGGARVLSPVIVISGNTERSKESKMNGKEN